MLCAVKECNGIPLCIRRSMSSQKSSMFDHCGLHKWDTNKPSVLTALKPYFHVCVFNRLKSHYWKVNVKNGSGVGLSGKQIIAKHSLQLKAFKLCLVKGWRIPTTSPPLKRFAMFLRVLSPKRCAFRNCPVVRHVVRQAIIQHWDQNKQFYAWHMWRLGAENRLF